MTNNGVLNSITTRLLIWFLVIALVPLIIVTYFTYTTSTAALMTEVERGLVAVANTKVQELETLAGREQNNLDVLANIPTNVAQLEQLTQAFSEHGKDSAEYKAIDQQVRPFWQHAVDGYDYYDLFFISKTGEVVFTIAHEVDFGTNLYTGPYKDTELAKLFKQIKTSDDAKISDFKLYAPSNNEPALFAAAPIRKNGDFIGALVAQVDEHKFYNIISDYTGLGESGETFVGAKLGNRVEFLFPVRFDPESAFKRQVMIGADISVPIQLAVQELSGEGLSVDYRGTEVVAAWRYVPSLRWGLVTKIDEAEAFASVSQQRNIVLLLSSVTFVLVLITAMVVARSISKPIVAITQVATRIAEGDLNHSVQVSSRDEIGILSQAFNQMILKLREITSLNQQQLWLSTGQAQLNDHMRGGQEVGLLAANIIRFLCEYLEAKVGTLSLLKGETLSLAGSYAYMRRKNADGQFKLGEGMVGQAVLEKKPLIISPVPADYITINSTLGETAPKAIFVCPFMYEGQVIGAIELGFLNEVQETQIKFMEQVAENIAIAFNTAAARDRMSRLLAQSQQQAEELRVQEEELRATNEELASQTEALKASSALLEEKQVELEATNVELEEKAQIVQEKQQAVDKQNKALKITQQELERKAEELALASKYKSEFLANMSHELRTPLNSLLILARMLANNEEGNLTAEQVESMEIIYSGGTDLLNLINEILDLSKIEAGRMEFHFEAVALKELVTTMQNQFNHVAEGKKLAFEISVADDLPSIIKTDGQRVKQIIKNLLSNAFKFTERGRVVLRLHRPETTADLSRSGLDPRQAIAMSVTDSGIGMTPKQQKIVFEAFQQADGSTSRQYGGTGLGLSISRELAVKLGGQIDLVSEPNRGSTFTLYLPLTFEASDHEAVEVEVIVPPPPVAPKKRLMPIPVAPVMADDRHQVTEDDKVLLIIEDDPKFAKIVADISRKKGFKCLLAADGRTGLDLANSYKPSAIILDLDLPEMNGWEVLERLKSNAETRHIPVHIASVDDETMDAYKKGAVGYLTKPISPESLDKAFQQMGHFMAQGVKNLLLLEDNIALRHSVKKLLAGSDVEITEVGLGQDALALLRARQFDCMILDLTLPDMSGFEVLSRLNADEGLFKCPVIVYTGKELSKEENSELMRYADSVIIKGAKSPERLLDETALFLHRVVADMSEEKQRTLRELYVKEAELSGKKVLIVDDDTRNSFALSKLLVGKGLKIQLAPNGQKALELLEQTGDIDLVLMDIMMPVMDGYETMQQIRAMPQFRKLPIIALTAKAMKGDREKCLAAGANDYLSKPIDSNRLLSMLRVWLY